METLEWTGRWRELDDAAAARRFALEVVASAWTGRVRITLVRRSENVDAVSAGPIELQCWSDFVPLPKHLDGPPLPPRSPIDIRGEVVCGCRDALAIALRARLITRERVLDLLHEVDKSFDAGMLEGSD